MKNEKMKVVTRKQIAREVKKAYKEGRDWNRIDFGHYHQVVVDAYSAKIHCSVYVSRSSWTVRDASDLVLTAWGPSVKEREAYMIDEAVEFLRANGWEVTE